MGGVKFGMVSTKSRLSLLPRITLILFSPNNEHASVPLVLKIKEEWAQNRSLITVSREDLSFQMLFSVQQVHKRIPTKG